MAQDMPLPLLLNELQSVVAVELVACMVVVETVVPLFDLQTQL